MDIDSHSSLPFLAAQKGEISNIFLLTFSQRARKKGVKKCTGALLLSKSMANAHSANELIIIVWSKPSYGKIHCQIRNIWISTTRGYWTTVNRKKKRGGFHTYFSMIEKCRGLLNRKGWQKVTLFDCSWWGCTDDVPSLTPLLKRLRSSCVPQLWNFWPIGQYICYRFFNSNHRSFMRQTI